METWQCTAAARSPERGIEPATSCLTEPELPGRRGVVEIRTAEVRRLLAAKLKLLPPVIRSGTVSSSNGCVYILSVGTSSTRQAKSIGFIPGSEPSPSRCVEPLFWGLRFNPAPRWSQTKALKLTLKLL